MAGQRFHLFGLVGAIGLWGGCELTPNPVTGRPEIVLMTPEKEREIGDEQSRHVEAHMGLAQDAVWQAYVQELGSRLARRSPRRGVDYRFFLIEMDDANAFALPDGRIYISRELLLLTQSESELANVLAHEIGHVAARHHAQRDAHQKTLGLSTLASRIASGGGEKGGEWIGGIDGVYAYSRNQERQADTIGMELAAGSGFDPQGMGDFLRTLDRAGRLERGYSFTESYFATHPATPERIAEASSRAEVDRHANLDRVLAKSDRAYLDRFEGMPAERPAAEGVFVGTRFLHADFGFALRFPSGWELANQSAQVVAVSPRKDALVMLQLAGEGEDPEAVARAEAEEQEFELGVGAKVRVLGNPAYRARVSEFPTPFGPLEGEVTWVYLDGRMFRLVTGVDKGSPARYAGSFRKFARSLRALTPKERDEIEELRVHIVVPREGEGLRALSRRTQNEWSLGRTALVNGLQVDERLGPDVRLKVAVRHGYRSQAPVEASDP